MSTVTLVLLVTGSRDWDDPLSLKAALDQARDDAAQYAAEHDLDVTLVVRHGDCRPRRDPRTGRLPAKSADWLAHRWVLDFTDAHRASGVTVVADPMPADWTAPCRPTCPPNHRREKIPGRSTCPWAGHYRNQEMVDKEPRPDTAIAFWKNRSRGTADCMTRLREAGIEPEIIEPTARRAA